MDRSVNAGTRQIIRADKRNEDAEAAMAWEYSEKTKQIFMDAVHGKPGTHLGEIEDPDGFGEHGSIACGDALRFTFRSNVIRPTQPRTSSPRRDT